MGGRGMGSGNMGSWGPWGAQWSGSWPGGPWGARGSRPGPPPWMQGLFGAPQQTQRGPKVRRGDVRAAILDVLRTEPMNGYQVMQQIAERSGGAWKPSPGSVYPTIQQLEDEGLVEAADVPGQRKLKPTTAGWAYIDEHRDELTEVWAPFEAPQRDEEEHGVGFADLKPEIGRVMGAVWQIVTQGSDRQRREAIEILVDTRRRLYGLLADGDDAEDGDEGEEAAS